MASHEIVPLKCPSCGSSNTGSSTPLAFGAEFTCAKCGGTSVLIINRALLAVDALQKSGDQVCAVCGRVAKVDARFCQDGHKLVRTCLNRECGKEFAAHHQRCDYCGWDQEVKFSKPGTPEDYERQLDRAIAKLSDQIDEGQFGYVDVYLKDIVAIWVASGLGKRAVPSILALLQVPNAPEQKLAWYVLARMGEAASATIPLLRQRTVENPGEMLYWKVLAMIAPLEVLPHCQSRIESIEKNPQCPSPNYFKLRNALELTAFVGGPAIPMLLEFCGRFSGQQGKECQGLVDEMSKRGRKALVISCGECEEYWVKTDGSSRNWTISP